jgi:hypothetical protein
MLEPRAQVQSYPASLAERRDRVTARLAGHVTPVEAIHAVREILDELQTLDLSERTTRERLIGERALKIVRDAAGLLRAVRAEAGWPTLAHAASTRLNWPWRILGFVVMQFVVGLGLIAVLAGAFQRPTTVGDTGLLFALVLAVGLALLQAITASRLVGMARARPPAAEAQPNIALRVDGDAVLSALSQALASVDQLEQAAALPPEPAAQRPSGLAEYPDVLRAMQQVYAAHLSGDAQRALHRAEGLRASLEQYGIEVRDRWSADEPPPPDLFAVQRSTDPTATTYRVILPALTDASGVILPGRIAAPGREAAP